MIGYIESNRKSTLILKTYRLNIIYGETNQQPMCVLNQTNKHHSYCKLILIIAELKMRWSSKNIGNFTIGKEPNIYSHK